MFNELQQKNMQIRTRAGTQHSEVRNMEQTVILSFHSHSLSITSLLDAEN